MYEFSEHACTLPGQGAGADGGGGVLGRAYTRYCLVSEHDVRARRLFRSAAMFAHERRRHRRHHRCTLHPLSRLSFIWEAYLTICYLLQAFMMHFRFSKYPKGSRVHLFMIDVSGCIDIVLKMFTGYMSGTHVVLELSAVRARYLRGYFLVDLLSALALVRKLGWSLRPALVFASMKAFRVFTLLKYFDNCMSAMNVGPACSAAAKVVVLGTLYLEYNIMFQFLVEYIYAGSFEPQKPSQCSWITIANLWNATHAKRYVFAFDRAVAMLRQNNNMNLMEKDRCPLSDLFTIIAWIISKSLFYYSLFMITAVAISSESAEAKFFVMTRQVRKCAERRALPAACRRSMVQCYGIRFHSNFYQESYIAECTAAVRRLREDLVLQSAHQVVRGVPFLQRVPRAQRVRAARALRPLVALPGHAVIIVNAIGDCLYLIDKGTVAIYTESGCEVCHLDDGDYFGEVALLRRGRRRSASVVAVTRCELFQLQRDVFAECVAPYPDVAEAVRTLAATRLHLTAAAEQRHLANMATDNQL